MLGPTTNDLIIFLEQDRDTPKTDLVSADYDDICPTPEIWNGLKLRINRE